MQQEETLSDEAAEKIWQLKESLTESNKAMYKDILAKIEKIRRLTKEAKSSTKEEIRNAQKESRKVKLEQEGAARKKEKNLQHQKTTGIILKSEAWL